MVCPSCTALYAGFFVLVDPSALNKCGCCSMAEVINEVTVSGHLHFVFAGSPPDIFRLPRPSLGLRAASPQSPSTDSPSLDYPSSAQKTSAILRDYFRALLAIISAVS